MATNTKIIATIGPSTYTKETLRKMIIRGVNVCRINFSHITHEKAKEIISLVKTVNQELNVNTAILADLQGPKIRIGELKQPLKVSIGDELLFTTKRQKNKNRIHI